MANPGSKSMDVVLKNNLEPVIFNHRMLDLYSTANSPVDIHLKCNTGMNRYGFEASIYTSGIAILFLELL